MTLRIMCKPPPNLKGNDGVEGDERDLTLVGFMLEVEFYVSLVIFTN